MNSRDSIRSTRRSVIAWQRLTRSHQQISRREREALAPYNLTTAQFDILSQLSRNPGLSQQALAGRLLVTKGNICGLIDRLETAGLVERQDTPDDRRSYQLFLTPNGKALFEQAVPALEQELTSIFSKFTEDELTNLSGLLTRLDNNNPLSISTPLEA